MEPSHPVRGTPVVPCPRLYMNRRQTTPAPSSRWATGFSWPQAWSTGTRCWHRRATAARSSSVLCDSVRVNIWIGDRRRNW